MGGSTSTVIGIDVGGTKIAGAIVDLHNGSVTARRERATRPERGGERVLSDVVELAANLADELGDRLGAGDTSVDTRIGVAVCELVDTSGNVTSAQSFDWRDIDVPASFTDIGPAVVASDVRAGAAAEASFGSGRDVDPFVYVSVGTGVSSTLVVDGEPYAGRHGTALIAASGTFSTRCPHCAETVEVVPEAIASGLGMVRRMRAGRPDIAIERAEEVLEAAEEGDEEARAIVAEGGSMLGTIVAGLINVLDPEAVVIGGGLGLATGSYRERFEASLAEHIWAPTSRGTAVIDAALGSDAALIGAAIAAGELHRGDP